jgi:hypothetical protein
MALIRRVAPVAASAAPVAASEATALATPLAALEATAPVAAAAQRMWLRWRQRGPWLPRRWLEDA